jgi:hypothetical protein
MLPSKFVPQTVLKPIFFIFWGIKKALQQYAKALLGF